LWSRLIQVFSSKKDEKEEPKDYEIVNLLESCDIDPDILALDDTIQLTEALSRYLTNLSIDLGTIKREGTLDLKRLNSSIQKIRKIAEDASELSNQLEQLITHYHDPLLERLKKIYDIKQDERVIKIISKLEEHKELLKNTATKLKESIIYDEMFSIESRSIDSLEKDLREKIESESFTDKFKELKKEIDTNILGQKGIRVMINPELPAKINKLLYED